MVENFHELSPTCAVPSSPDINLVDYFVWGMVETDSSRYPHNTVAAVRAAIVYAMANIPNTHLIIACSLLKQHAEDVIGPDGG